MNTLYLLTGGNMGDRDANLHAAASGIESSIGSIKAASAIYETAPWGYTDQAPFLNQVLLVSTPLSAVEVLEQVLSVEMALGRERLEKMGPRTIDIDILYYNDDIVEQPDLTIPHPHLQDRKFVLVPLAEIAPEFVHPILLKTNKQLLDECTDTLEVHTHTSVS